MAAQSPTAQRPRWPFTRSALSTITAPRLSCSTGRVLSNGFGAVPAVHIKVLARISSVGLKITAPGRASIKRVLSLKVTPRSAIRLRIAGERLAQLGQNAIARMDEDSAQFLCLEVRIIGQHAAGKVIQRASQLHAGKATASDHEG